MTADGEVFFEVETAHGGRVRMAVDGDVLRMTATADAGEGDGAPSLTLTLTRGECGLMAAHLDAFFQGVL